MKLRILTVDGLLQPQADDSDVSLCSPSCPHLRRFGGWSGDARCWFYGQKLALGHDGVDHKRCAPCLQGTEVEA